MPKFASADPHPPTVPQGDIVNATRLYISPLSSETLPIILPTSQQSTLLSPPSFHHPGTFPEKSFGYLELPRETADRLRKKLHGSILKGIKMRVEEAKPERGASGTTRKRKAEVVAENQASESDTGKRTRRSKKPEEGVVKGEELPAGRRVKRGWEESSKSSKKEVKKPDTPVEERQMVFRTSVPPNKAPNLVEDPSKSKSHKKSKKNKSGAHEVEVKEFEKTQKVPTFLRGSSKPGKHGKAVYDDEKGWIDEDGNVVEEVKKPRKSSKSKKTSEAEPNTDEPIPSTEEPVYTNGTNTLTAPATTTELLPAKDNTPKIAVDSTAAIDDNANDMDGSLTGAVDEPILANEDTPKPASALEALFKRPAPSSKSKPNNRPAPLKFSFFGSDEAGKDADAADDANGDENTTPDPDIPIDSAASTELSNIVRRRRLASLQIPPQTPFTRRDLEQRGLRSAAPTPDTAAIGKHVKAPWKRSQTRSVSRETDEDSNSSLLDKQSSMLRETIEEEPEPVSGEDEEGIEDSMAETVKVKVEGSPPEGLTKGKNGKEQTEFEKKFYEMRGDLNRDWKRQRREGRKSARQASNRRGGRV